MVSRFIVSGGPPRLATGDPTGNCDSSASRARGTAKSDREGTIRELRYAMRHLNVTRPKSDRSTPAIAGTRHARPIRLTVAHQLGSDIDGAWWPRADRITNELPNLVAVLTPLLGEISSINVNWSPLQRPPDLNWPGWEGKRQHVITLSGTQACANLLVISYATHSALALMVMRCAANLPIDPADHNKPACLTAGSILRHARQQRGPTELHNSDAR